MSTSVAGELIANAVRHADPLPGGVVRLAWRLRNLRQRGRSVEVRVTDGGSLSCPGHARPARQEPRRAGIDDRRSTRPTVGVSTGTVSGSLVWAELS